MDTSFAGEPAKEVSCSRILVKVRARVNAEKRADRLKDSTILTIQIIPAGLSRI